MSASPHLTQRDWGVAGEVGETRCCRGIAPVARLKLPPQVISRSADWLVGPYTTVVGNDFFG